MRHFNPRSPHGERQQSSPAYAPFVPFQSTLPARGATAQFDKVFQQIAFQSTLPARGATFSGKVIYQHILISIHAPRTGSDSVTACPSPQHQDFNPRSPHGERPYVRREAIELVEFQSTLPARGATFGADARNQGNSDFNPRSPHGERPLRNRGHLAIADFNPRSPHGERRAEAESPDARRVRISIHAPRTGSDQHIAHILAILVISIHAPRTGSDRFA